jgi:hypothetical protein
MHEIITLFYSDFVEKQALIPLKAEFENRGYSCKLSTNFDESSEIGIYACHSNYFALNKPDGWYRPPSKFSVLCLHDLWYDNGQRSSMFFHDSWHIFDLVLLPGRRWMDIYQDALDKSFQGSRLGVREVGWPVSDSIFNIPNDIARDNLKAQLNLDNSKKTILLGASWQSRSMIEDCINFLDKGKYNLVAKFFNWQSTDFGDGPWADIFRAQFKETKLTVDLAQNTGFYIAPFDINISNLLSCVDVVLSNGSNIMFEGLLQKKPSICIYDWFHPAGYRGQFKNYPSVDMVGILNGSRRDLAALVEAAISLEKSPLLALGRGLLVSEDNLGKGAFLSVEAILEAYQLKATNNNSKSITLQKRTISEIEIFQNDLLKDPDMQFDVSNVFHLKEKIDSMRTEYNDLDCLYRSVINSKSWRITKPLRVIRRLVSYFTKR